MFKRRLEVVAIAATLFLSVSSLVLVLSGVVNAGPSAAPAASPGVPTLISYQGFLSDPETGQPLPDDTYTMHFGIYDAADGGSLLWEEPTAPTVIPVQVKNGVFTVLLGSITPLSPSIFAGGSAYVEVQIEGQTLEPRQQILSVAYAMVAETLDGETLADLDDRYVNSTGDTIMSQLVVDSDGSGVPDFIVKNQAGGTNNISIDGTTSLIDVGTNGEDGDIYVRDGDTGEISIQLDGVFGHMILGAPSEDGDIWIQNSSDTTTINLDGATGDVSYQGALVGAFPRPAYDSGYLTYADGGETKTLNHNIGGNPDDYVVEIHCKYAVDGLAHNYYVGGEHDSSGNVLGVTWDNLQSNSIVIARWEDDPFCDQVRVRIWEIK